jgi:hypothetical protein
MKKAFPGYTIIPIDIRGFEDDKDLYTGFDGTGGAIHCITKQIPAENPIRILHKPIQDFVAGAVYNGNFPIKATITNKSGIQSATCFWRVKGESTWQQLPLAAGANNMFSAILNSPATMEYDTIEYYLSAVSNNGKTITKPMTAPDGFYSFYHGDDMAVTALVYPTAKAFDDVDSAINLKVTINNNSANRIYDTVVVHAIISDGANPDVELFDTIFDFAPGAITHQFDSSYIVPALADYTVTIFVENLDICPHNDTLKIERRTILKEDIAMLAVVNPKTNDIGIIGNAINLEIQLENQSYTKIYNTVEVKALIKAKGKSNVSLSGTITNFAPGTKNYTFNTPYTVPNVSEYTIQVFVTSIDNYKKNDTITVTRGTSVGINDYRNTGFALGQNFPNPARDNTRIEYKVPTDGQVVFTVYSITGQRLYMEKINARSGENSIDFNTANLTNGIYYYFMEYNKERLVKKMIIGK